MMADIKFEDYIIESMSSEANYQYDIDEMHSYESKLGLDIQVKKKIDEPSYMIKLDINANEDAESFSVNPYRIHILICGFFSFGEDVQVNEMKKLVHLNGTAMLYGIARGFVSQITANGPHGPFLLPSVNLLEYFRNRQETKLDETRGKPINENDEESKQLSE